MPTTGKKRLTVELENLEIDDLRTFKINCVKAGKSLKEIILELIRDYNHKNVNGAYEKQPRESNCVKVPK